MGPSSEADDEFIAVSSIFFDCTRVEPPRTVVCSFGDVHVTFVVPDTYPESASPAIEVSAPSIAANVKLELKQKLQALAAEKRGELVLYDCISAAKEFVDNLAATYSQAAENSTSVEMASIEPVISVPQVPVPEIYGTDTLSDRKSVFQAHIAKIDSKEQAMAVMDALRSNTKIARATHRIYAYRTKVIKNGRALPLHDCDDDGETGASSKLLNLLELMRVDNVIVVVTRWYGGIHLGSDRFRHIQNMARKAIVESGLAPTH